MGKETAWKLQRSGQVNVVSLSLSKEISMESTHRATKFMLYFGERLQIEQIHSVTVTHDVGRTLAQRESGCKREAKQHTPS